MKLINCHIHCSICISTPSLSACFSNCSQVSLAKVTFLQILLSTSIIVILSASTTDQYLKLGICYAFVEMPKSDQWYPRKKPRLQVDILKSIALNGGLSQKQATVQFRCKPPTISEAFKIMEKRRRLIQRTNASELSNSVIRRERFYKLSPQGLLAFIDENPSPYEFWIGLMWYCSLNPKLVDKAEFNRYYDIFIQKFVGNYSPLRSCFFLSDSFDGVFRRWSIIFANYQIPGTDAYHKHHETEQAYKVLKCLLQNRRNYN